MRNKFIILALLSVVLFITGCFQDYKLTPKEQDYLKNKDTITFVSQRRYPPFEYVNKYGQITGMTIELIRWMGIEYNFNPHFLHTNFANAKNMVLSGEADAITTFFYSSKRDEKYDFTDMIFNVPASIFVKSTNNNIKGSEDLNGKTLAIQQGDYALDFLDTNNVNYNLILTDNFEQAANKVLNAQADAAIADEQIVIHYLKSLNMLDKIKIVGDPLYVGKDCLAVAEGNSTLVSILNKALIKARQEGALQKIKHKWLGSQLPSPYVKYTPYLIIASLLLIGLVIFIWYWNITLKKQVYLKTMELRNREKNLLEILAAARDSAIIKSEPRNNEWKIVIFNAGAEKIFRYRNYEVKGESLEMICTEDNVGELKEIIEEVKAKHEGVKQDGVTGEMHFIKKSGDSFPALFSVNPIFDKYDNLVSVILVITDITKRKKAEEAIKENADRLNALINASPDFICFKDGQGRWLITNEAGLKLFSLENVNYYKKTDIELAEIVDDCYKEAFKSCFYSDEKAWQSGGIFRSEEVIPNPEGSQRILDTVKVPLFNEKGERKNMVILGRDITEIKHYEEEIIEEREYLDVTLRSIGDAVISTDANGKVVIINSVAEKLTGIARRDAVGRHINEIFRIISRKSGKKVKTPYEKVISSEKKLTLESDTVLLSKNGSRYIIAESGAPILAKNKEIIGVVIVFRDVTGREKMQEELFKMEKLKSVGVLAGGIAHDFNNILTAISSNISLAGILHDKEKIDSIYQKINSSISRAKSLTNQLLTFSKGGSPVMSESSVEEVVKDTADFTLTGSNIKVEYEMDDFLPQIQMDIGQISQVFQNLAVNAKDSMPDGGRLFIKIAQKEITDFKDLESGNYISIQFWDEGVGVPFEIQDNLFDPFFTTKETGSGLGLSTSYAIVKKHGGGIYFDSWSDGSKFTVYLPVKQGINSDTNVQNEGKERHLDIGNERDIFSGRKLFMLDDEESILESSEMYLQTLGFEITTAKDEKEAVEKFKKSTFDVAIIDLTIPGSRSGEQILKSLKSIDKNVKTVVTSGYSENDVMKNFKEYGFDECILKPYDLNRLAEILYKLINTEKDRSVFF